MRTTINTKLKSLFVLTVILLSGCRICMVCTGLSQEPCKSALPHVRPMLDSLYARHFHVKKWGVENCSYDRQTAVITLITIPNPAKGMLGITLILDTNYVVDGVFYPKGKPYRY